MQSNDMCTIMIIMQSNSKHNNYFSHFDHPCHVAGIERAVGMSTLGVNSKGRDVALRMAGELEEVAEMGGE